MTPEQRGATVKQKFGERWRRLMNEAAGLLLSRKKSFGKRAYRMLEITDSLASTVAPVAACRRGCSYCCHQSTIISSWEADRIGKVIGRPRAEVPKVSRASLAPMRDKYTGVACVFLKNGECSIYDVRPLICRTHFNVSDDPTLCDASKYPGGTVPYYDFRQLQFFQGTLFFDSGCDFADIRDFFPSPSV